jgi:hypothetical protein
VCWDDLLVVVNAALKNCWRIAASILEYAPIDELYMVREHHKLQVTSSLPEPFQLDQLLIKGKVQIFTNGLYKFGSSRHKSLTEHNMQVYL